MNGNGLSIIKRDGSKEKLNLDKAMDQAIRDCGKNVPYVAHRKNSKQWLVTLQLADLKTFARLVHQEILLAKHE